LKHGITLGYKHGFYHVIDCRKCILDLKEQWDKELKEWDIKNGIAS